MWETLRPRITTEVKSLDEANNRFFPHMSQSLPNWAGDFCLEALNGSLTDRRCGELGIQFIRELLNTLPAEHERLNFQGDLATLYFRTQRIAEGEQCCEQLIRDHPDRAIGYAALSDGLLDGAAKKAPAPVSILRAITVLEQALARPVTDADDFDLPARLAEARQLLPKAAET
jgi:hypothetical protein